MNHFINSRFILEVNYALPYNNGLDSMMRWHNEHKTCAIRNDPPPTHTPAARTLATLLGIHSRRLCYTPSVTAVYFWCKNVASSVLGFVRGSWTSVRFVLIRPTNILWAIEFRLGDWARYERRFTSIYWYHCLTRGFNMMQSIDVLE